MIDVKVFGSTPPCSKCKEVEKRANKVAEKFSNQVKVTKLDAISDEGLKYQVMFTPTLVVNDKVVAAGEVVSESEIEEAIKKAME